MQHDANDDTDLESLYLEQSQEDEDTSIAIRCTNHQLPTSNNDSSSNDYFVLNAESIPALNIQ